MANYESTQPLVPPSKTNHPHRNPLPRVVSVSALALGGLRGVLGISCLAAPLLTSHLFRYELPPEGALALRLFGARELVLGGLLINARNAVIASAGGPGNLRTIFLANLITDSIDIGSVLVGEVSGTVKWDAAALIGGGAATGIALAVAGLRGLGRV